MGCGGCEPKKMVKYVCEACGKEEMKEVTEDEVKSCCGQPMEKKEE